MSLPDKVEHLSNVLASLPGVGPKLSKRLSVYLAVKGKGLAAQLQLSLGDMIDSVKLCKTCGNISEKDECWICIDSARDKSLVMVVEDSIDLDNISQSGDYKGVFHVLNGVISPVNGVGPSDINIKSLVSRVKDDNRIKEITFALNPNIEGDSTSMYLKDMLVEVRPDLIFSRLAKGIPVGGDIEFASPQTISDSFNSRTKF